MNNKFKLILFSIIKLEIFQQINTLEPDANKEPYFKSLPVLLSILITLLTLVIILFYCISQFPGNNPQHPCDI